MGICLYLLASLFTFSTVVMAEAPASVPIKIGVSSALTGGAESYGMDVKDAIQFANEKLGHGRYKLIFEDDKCNGKDAVTVAKKFIDIDQVDFVIGFVCSGAALAAAPLYEKAQIPTLVVLASSPAISNAGDYIFRTTPSDILAAKQLHAHIAKQKISSLAILSEESEYAQDLKNAFIAANASNNTLHITDQSYLPNTTDFRTQLSLIRSKEVEGIFINSQAEGTFAIIVQQLQAIGWQPQRYGAYWPASPVFLKQAGELADGIEFVDTPSLDYLLNAEGKSLFAEFKSKYGEIRSIESSFASGFEAFRALDLASRSGVPVKEYLSTRDFTGIFGSYRFDVNGDIEGLSFQTKTIRNKKPVVL